LTEGFFLLSAQHGQHDQGEHGQSNVSIPALTVANFIVVKAALAFGDGRQLEVPVNDKQNSRCNDN